MHARVITADVQPENLEALAQGIREGVMPEAHKQQGFKGALLLTDDKDGKVIYISFWEGEDHLQTSEISGYVRQQLARTAHLLSTPPVLATYELRVQEGIESSL